MGCKKIVASTILSLLLSIILVYPNCIVVAEDVATSNLISTGQGIVANPNDLTVTKNVVGPDSKATEPYTVAIKAAGSLLETSHSISAGSQTITGLSPGDYSISETDSHSATIVDILPPNFTITMGVSSIWASFGNTGTKDTGPLVWDLYYAAAGNPMTGSKIATGGFGPITLGGSGNIQYTLTAADAPGSYMFNVYESPGGLSASLWSGQIDVSAIVTPSPVINITNTYGSQGQGNGTLRIVKSLAGTALTPPTSGFKVRITPSGGGTSIDTDIDSISAKDVSLAPGDYTIDEFETLSADVVDYSTNRVTIAPGSIFTVSITNTFNNKTDIPLYTGDLNVIKVLTGTSPSPPTSGFVIRLTPSLGGASVDQAIISGSNVIKSLAVDNYTLVETGSNGAEKVEYSYDNVTWSTAPGPIPIAPGSTSIYYIRNTFNSIIPDNPGDGGGPDDPVPVTITYEPVTVPAAPPVLVPKKELVVVKSPVAAPKEEIIVPDPVPELPYTGAVGTDMTCWGLLLTVGGMALRRLRP